MPALPYLRREVRSLCIEGGKRENCYLPVGIAVLFKVIQVLDWNWPSLGLQPVDLSRPVPAAFMLTTVPFFLGEDVDVLFCCRTLGNACQRVSRWA